MMAAAGTVVRMVIDTNVIVSAVLAPHGTAGRAVKAALFRQPIVSPSMVTELIDVLGRPKFDRHVSREARRAFLAHYLRVAEWVSPTQSVSICRDEKDNRFIEAALTGLADAIVTGDDDLLSLDAVSGVPIIAPSTFLARITDLWCP